MNAQSQTLIMVALFSLAVGARAETDRAAPGQITESDIFATKPGLHLVLDAGITYGGTTIYTVHHKGNINEIKAGALGQAGIGVLWQLESHPVALKLSANFHTDVISGSYGEAKFERNVFELLAYHTGKERYRFGGGVRIVNSPVASMLWYGQGEMKTYVSTTGLVAEAGYKLTPHVWMNLRAVSEKYQGRTLYTGGTPISLAGTPKINGSHLGLIFSYEF